MVSYFHSVKLISITFSNKKMKRIIKTSLALFLTVIGLSSCLEDKGYTDLINGVGNDKSYVSIFGDDGGAKILTLDVSPVAADVKLFRLNLASVTPLSIDTKVTLAIDNSVIKTIVGAEAVPANAIVFSPDATIPANTRDVQFSVKINSSLLDLTKLYVLPIKIVSATNNTIVAGNNSSVVYTLAIKNKYDGVYTLTGQMVDFANATLTGNYPTEVEFRTAGGKKIEMWDKTGGVALRHTILSGGALSSYGTFGVVITFNDDDTVASVVNSYEPAANGRTGQLDPSGVNKWDAKTKTLKIKYWMNQPSVISPHRTSFDETFTFKSAR
jgi:hypothetical protein